MAIVTPSEYYSDEDAHGNYQYVPLVELIDDLEIETQDDDSYLKNTKRYKIIHHLRRGLQSIYKAAGNDVQGFCITVPTNLSFALPRDYMQYVRVSVIELDTSTGAKRLRVLDVNKNMNTAIGYLQDHNADLLFDQEGYILMSDGDNAYGQPHQTLPFCKTGSQYHLDTSALSEHGEFIFDEQRVKMLFSSNLMDRDIVFEYISDGLHADLDEGQIKVHKHLIAPLKDWAYYACIEGKRTVPMNEKMRALRRYKTTLHQAKLDRADFNFFEISRAFRVQSKFK